VEVSLSSLAVSCDALRAGEQTININADPDRAAALIAKFRSLPAWFPPAGPAASWRWIARSGLRPPTGATATSSIRTGLATAIVNVLSKTLSAKSSSTTWNANTGKTEIDVQTAEPDIPRARPHRDNRAFRPGGAGQAGRIRPAVAVDRKPRHFDGGRNRGRKTQSDRGVSGDEEGEQKDDNGSVDALAKAFKAQRWDADKSVWK